MASSNRRLAIWFCIAIGIVVAGIAIGEISAAEPYHVEIVGPFLGGAILALSLASWSLETDERRKEATLRAFWRPLAEDIYVILPSLELDEVASESLLTVYHDAVASYAVQHLLHSKWRSTSTVISSNQVSELADIASHNILLIGGPNYNVATSLFMDELWQAYGEAFFQWSSSLAARPATAALVRPGEDHLLKVEKVDGSSYVVSDEIHDVRDKESRTTSDAKGMCVRADGVMRDDRSILLIAGVDAAFGTLAAARYLLDPLNLPLSQSRILQVIVGARVYGYDIGRPVGIRVLQR
jgi:hypothetical protein